MKLPSGFGAFRPKPSTVVLIACVCLSAPAAAQQRTLPDSLRQDSLRRARGDTTRVLADSVKPPPILAKHAVTFDTDFGGTVREWTRDQLLLEGAITLGELLDQFAGQSPIRSGLFLQPEASTSIGQTRPGVQVLVDGYELDPLSEGSLDLARIQLASLNAVRIERRLDVTRIVLNTLEPTDGRAHSRIDAGVGEPNVNLFRGVFLAPKFLIGPLGFTIERVDTDGLRQREPADDFAGWVKWAYIRGRTGIQLEYQQFTLNRNPNSLWLGESKRSDLVVRARAPIGENLVAELFGGYSKFKNDTSVVLIDTEEEQPANIESNVAQWGGRASFQNSAVWADATVRFRNHELLPAFQFDGGVGVRIPKIASFAGYVTSADWGDAGNAFSFDLRGQTGSLAGIYAFAEVAGGERGAPSAFFESVDSAFVGERSGMRAGLGIERWGAKASAAIVKEKSDSVQTFGLPFDRTDQHFGNSDLTGWEAVWSVPIWLKEIRAVGNYTNWMDGTFSIYTPAQQWRAGIELHWLPLKTNSLEIFGWMELRHRSDMLAPVLPEDSTVWELTTVEGDDVINGYLQIRILDVRLFIRGENLTNRPVEELPGRRVQTPRYLYGIKWTFWN
jgi:hypothetical protein